MQQPQVHHQQRAHGHPFPRGRRHPHLPLLRKRAGHQQGRTCVRITFNEMYGHVFNLKENIKKMIRKLEKLEYGGYGESKIKEFESTANKIIEEGHSVGKEDNTILANIEIVFKSTIR